MSSEMVADPERNLTMAGKLRMFVPGSPPPQLPANWAEAIEMPKYRTQGDFIVIARTKASMHDMLMQRNAGETTASWIVKGSRMEPEQRYWDGAELLVDAGVVDVAVPSVHIFYGLSADKPIIRVEEGGHLITVAYFRRKDRKTYNLCVELAEGWGKES